MQGAQHLSPLVRGNAFLGACLADSGASIDTKVMVLEELLKIEIKSSSGLTGTSPGHRDLMKSSTVLGFPCLDALGALVSPSAAESVMNIVSRVLHGDLTPGTTLRSVEYAAMLLSRWDWDLQLTVWSHFVTDLSRFVESQAEQGNFADRKFALDEQTRETLDRHILNAIRPLRMRKGEPLFITRVILSRVEHLRNSNPEYRSLMMSSWCRMILEYTKISTNPILQTLLQDASCEEVVSNLNVMAEVSRLRASFPPQQIRTHTIRVNRHQLLQDSVAASHLLNSREIPRIEFIGEIGIDGGGLLREWYALVTRS